MATHPDPSDFTTRIDNPLFILRPGTTFVYDNKDENSTDTFTVTHETRIVDGVECVVVHDTERVNGLIVEDTFDWFAQDSDGNVWYFGEDTAEFEPGNPNPINSSGAWEAGVDGAEAGIIMKADPQVGDQYQQEFAPGVAEDFARVLDLSASASVPYAASDTALETLDVNPLDPSEEHKFYIEGVGTVLTTDEDGNRQELVKVIVEGEVGDDRLLGFAGDDYIFGKGGDDVLRGLSGGDRIEGGRGDDLLGGGTGRDFLSGGGGDDSLRGGDGGDDLAGSAGNDRLTGGEGADAFIFRNLRNGATETDTISDYSRDDVDALSFHGGADGVTAEALVSGNWRITLKGDGDVIVLLGVADGNGDGYIVDDLLFT